MSASSPNQRHLTEEQKQTIIAALRPFAENTDIDFVGSTEDLESSNYSEELLNTLAAAGLKPKKTWLAVVPSPLAGIRVIVRDGQNPPAIATALVKALKEAGVEDVSEEANPEWPEDRKDRVVLFVQNNPLCLEK